MMYRVIEPMTVCWCYRWSVSTCLSDFVWWLRRPSDICGRIQSLPCWCMSCTCNRVSPIKDFHVVRFVRWTAGKTSSFKVLNCLQLVVHCSCSTSGCLNLFRLFLLQISVLQFCFSDLLVYLNGVILYSSPMFCFSSDFSSDSLRCFWVWSHKVAVHVFCVSTLVWSGSASHYDATFSGIICEVFCLFVM